MSNFEDYEDYDGYDDEPSEDIGYECSGYFDGEDWVCPLIGSEECDWECPEGGLANLRKSMEEEEVPTNKGDGS